MPIAPPNAAGVELCYEVFGDDDGVPLLLVMGLGAQLLSWDTEFCQALVDRGFMVIRYDNRDVGLSTKIEGGNGGGGDFMSAFTAALQGESIEPPYLLTDMADDAAGLLDHLDIDAAHVVGASMGGMIAQAVAIEHPHRVLTLTSIMSTTGDQDVGQPLPDAMQRLLGAPPTSRDEAIESGVETSRIIGSPELFDEDRAREKAAESYDRCFYPAGMARQLLAIVASGSRSEQLANVDVPTLVIHGSADPLVTPSGGERTAEVVPGAELLMIEGMGHDLPPVHWTQVVAAITALAARAPVPQA
jgi:pimeloyl-ACP methyl ester carboxylesterase